MRKILILTILGFALLLCSGNAGAAPVVVDGSETFNGELTLSSQNWSTHWGQFTYYFDIQEFQVSAGGNYRIEVVAADLDDGANDTRLSLLDGSFNLIQADDDSGSDLLSMIEIGLSAGTDYVFSVETYSPNTLGTWEVQISSVPTPVPTAGLLMGCGLLGLAGLRRRN